MKLAPLSSIAAFPPRDLFEVVVGLLEVQPPSGDLPLCCVIYYVFFQVGHRVSDGGVEATASLCIQVTV